MNKDYFSTLSDAALHHTIRDIGEALGICGTYSLACHDKYKAQMDAACEVRRERLVARSTHTACVDVAGHLRKVV